MEEENINKMEDVESAPLGVPGNTELVGEEMEFSLTELEIDELITKLCLLKTNREPFNFDVDEENSFLISYEETEEGELECPQILV